MADRDPAIEEIRAVRRAISAEFGHDTRALVRHYQELQQRHEDRLVRNHLPAPADGPPWMKDDRAGSGEA